MEPRKVLIIEDEPEIRLILSMSFQHSGVFDPILACDGVEGLEMARKVMPDLILLDVMMPRMDGYSTCRLLKEDEQLMNIPIIFLTAKTDQVEIDRAMRSGACGYLPKPFDPLLLIDQISRIITEPAK